MRTIKPGIFFVFVCVCLPLVYGSNKNKLSKTPLPKENFILERYLGTWFVQGYTEYCSWKGARKFSNFVSQYRSLPDGRIELIHTWRNIACTTAVHQYVPQDVPGAFLLLDNIGDVITGDSIVVETDYKTFAIKWGCTERILHGVCEDPYIVIKTRLAIPSPKTWQTIEYIIMNFFGLDLGDLTLYKQDNPCFVGSVPNIVPPKYGLGGKLLK